MQDAVKIAGAWSKDTVHYAACFQDGGALIGHRFAMPEGDTYSIGWHFNSQFEGKGFAMEAAKGMLDYLFIKKNARRIYCYVEDDNTRSQKLCERLAMRREGLFLEFVSFVDHADGTPHYENTMQYAILKKEWIEFMENNSPLHQAPK